jgi:pantetheine-phosphate adenylyltransferase/8-oxo-dGTP diphosphatase
MFMVEKGAALFDRLIVAVGVNPNKKCTFPLSERLAMLSECTAGLENVEVDSFEGQFLVHYAASKGANHILRGVRSEEDYRLERAMRNVNEDMEPGITTVLLIPPRQICEISSSFVKGLVGFEGWEEVVKPYVPEPVYKRLLTTDIRWGGERMGPEGGGD